MDMIAIYSFGIIREVYLNMCIIHLETSTKTYQNTEVQHFEHIRTNKNGGLAKPGPGPGRATIATTTRNYSRPPGPPPSRPGMK